jgi:hypothetical protein
MSNRRDFLKTLAAGIATAVAVPKVLKAKPKETKPPVEKVPVVNIPANKRNDAFVTHLNGNNGNLIVDIYASGMGNFSFESIFPVNLEVGDRVVVEVNNFDGRIFNFTGYVKEIHITIPTAVTAVQGIIDSSWLTP